MKALILAAGLGTRLYPITETRPKSLVPVNGKPILIKQLDNLAANGITDITVVSGYKADVLEKAVRDSYPSVRVIESRDYAVTNNMYSAYLAREYVEGSDFLMMNADVFMDASVITSLLACPYENAIVTDIGRYIEESMKVTEKDGRIISIAKTIPREEALGSSIDVYRFSPAGGKAFFNACRRYFEEMGELKKWSEVALADALADEVFKACPLSGRWFEIDDLTDLANAEALFKD